MFCKNCGTQIGASEKFCPNCGTQQDIVKSVDEKVEKKTKFNKENKLKSKKPIVIIAIAIVLIIAIILSIFAFPKIKKLLTPTESAMICYLKDGELFVNFSDELNSQQLTKKMILNDLESDEIAGAGFDLSYNCTRYCPDANRIFFPDRINADDTGMNLYYVDLDDVGKDTFEPVKVDSKVGAQYQVTSDGQKVYYVNTDDRTLYVNDLTSKNKIAENVDAFYVKQDDSSVVYTTFTDDEIINLYTYNAEGSSKEIAKDISIKYNSDDYSLICYQQNNKLYSLLNGTTIKEVFTVADEEDNYINVIYADDAGNIYYRVSEEVERPVVMDYVNDDLAQQDAAIVEPDRNNKSYWKEWTRYTWGDEVTEYAREYTSEYYDLLEKYEEKSERDALRESLKEQELYTSNRALYYFDGTKSNKMCDAVTYDTFIDDNIIVFSKENIEEAEKVNFSEICSSIEELDKYSAQNYVEEKVCDNLVYYALINNHLVEMAKGTGISSVKISSENNAIYYIQSTTEDELCGDLIKVDINGNGVSEPIKLYSMVGAYDIINNDIVYYRDPVLVNSEDSIIESDLYLNDKKIDSGVVGAANMSNYLSIRYLADGTIFYGTAQISDYEFTLKQFDGKETKTIASNIAQYIPISKDNVYFIDNYSSSYRAGDMKFFDGEETVKISSDVSYIYFPLAKAIEY